jgi:hypothetical protein
MHMRNDCNSFLGYSRIIFGVHWVSNAQKTWPIIIWLCKQPIVRTDMESRPWSRSKWASAAWLLVTANVRGCGDYGGMAECWLVEENRTNSKKAFSVTWSYTKTDGAKTEAPWKAAPVTYTASRTAARRLVAGFPPRRPGFEPESVHVRFEVDKMALGTGEGFLSVLRFPLPLIPPTAPHSSSIIWGWYNRLVVASVIVDGSPLNPKRQRNERGYCPQRHNGK